MFISSGEAFWQPKERFKEAKEVWPHAFIKMDNDPLSFIQEARSNHIHMIYGDYRKELFAFCKILGIRIITPS